MALPALVLVGVLGITGELDPDYEDIFVVKGLLAALLVSAQEPWFPINLVRVATQAAVPKRTLSAVFVLEYQPPAEGISLPVEDLGEGDVLQWSR